jgi:hypothetical protein
MITSGFRVITQLIALRVKLASALVVAVPSQLHIY